MPIAVFAGDGARTSVQPFAVGANEMRRAMRRGAQVVSHCGSNRWCESVTSRSAALFRSFNNLEHLDRCIHACEAPAPEPVLKLTVMDCRVALERIVSSPARSLDPREI